MSPEAIRILGIVNKIKGLVDYEDLKLVHEKVSYNGVSRRIGVWDYNTLHNEANAILKEFVTSNETLEQQKENAPIVISKIYANYDGATFSDLRGRGK
jgi:hypothetical protein